MGKFIDKEIEDSFYKEILSPKISDKDKITLIQDYMLIYHNEPIESDYAFLLLKIMACDIQSLKDKTIDHRPVFLLENANKLTHKYANHHYYKSKNTEQKKADE